MMNRIAIVAALVLATGCGASRPQHPTQTYKDAWTIWDQGGTYEEIATTLALRDRDEARAMVRVGIIERERRYNRGQ